MAGLPPFSSQECKFSLNFSNASADIWKFNRGSAISNNSDANLPLTLKQVVANQNNAGASTNQQNNAFAEEPRLPIFSKFCDFQDDHKLSMQESPEDKILNVTPRAAEDVLEMHNLHHMSSIMGITWRDKTSEDFSGLPLGAFLPHERRLRSLSMHQNPAEELLADSVPLAVAEVPAKATVQVPIVEEAPVVKESVELNWTSLKVSDQNEEVVVPDVPKKTTPPASSRFQHHQNMSKNNHHQQGQQHNSHHQGQFNRNGKVLHIRQFNTKLNSLAQKGDYNEVDRMIKHAESGDLKLDRAPNTRTYTIVVKAYCRANRIDLAEKLIKQMQEWEPSKKPNRFTFNTLMNGYVRKQNMAKANDLFNHMLSFPNPSERPDQVTYSTLIKGFAAIGDMSKAEELFEKLKRSAAEDNNACKPNHVTCNTMVKGYASIGAMDKAESLFNAMKKGESNLCSPDKVTYNTMIDGFAKNSQMNKAEELFNRMQSSNDPSLKPNQVTYNTMIDGYTKSGNMVMAEKIFEFLESFSPEELSQQSASDFHNGDSDDESGESKPSPVTYGAMINGYVKAGLLEKAEKLFEKIKRHPDPSCRPNQVTYTTMIGSYAKTGNMRKAESLFAEMMKSRNPHCKPNQVTYSILIDGYSKIGDMDSAERLLRQMRENSKTGDGTCRPNQVTYNTLIHGYAQGGDLNKAEQVFSFMKTSEDNSCKPNAITYRTMIHMYRQFGKTEESKQLCDNLSSQGLGHLKPEDI
jgi:pentatricopeptide repeat protein